MEEYTTTVEHDARDNGIRLVLVRRHKYSIGSHWLIQATDAFMGIWLIAILAAEFFWTGVPKFFLANTICLPLIAIWAASRLVVGAGRRRTPGIHVNESAKDNEDARLVCHGDSLELNHIAVRRTAWIAGCVRRRTTPTRFDVAAGCGRFRVLRPFMFPLLHPLALFSPPPPTVGGATP